MRNGYILLHRKGITPEEWKNPRRTLAWIDLLTLANYETGVVTVSYGFLAERWRVSKHTAYDWMRHFEGEGQLEKRGEREGEREGERGRERFGERWFVVNYAKYQGAGERFGEREGERGRERKGEQRKEVISIKSEEVSERNVAAAPPRPLGKNLYPLAVFVLCRKNRFDNYAQIEHCIKRYTKASSSLKGYTPRQIVAAMLYAEEQSKGEYDVTLDTVAKKIVEYKDTPIHPKYEQAVTTVLERFEAERDVLLSQRSPLIDAA